MLTQSETIVAIVLSLINSAIGHYEDKCHSDEEWLCQEVQRGKLNKSETQNW